MSPYQRPAFAQSFDKSRPHELLTANASKSGFLEYRMLDSGEVVSVPNACTDCCNARKLPQISS